jgi:hypothetical protein
MIRGPLGAPLSATVTCTDPGDQQISTANQPPAAPLAV